jgi:hypothetical protein
MNFCDKEGTSGVDGKRLGAENWREYLGIFSIW